MTGMPETCPYENLPVERRLSYEEFNPNTGQWTHCHDGEHFDPATGRFIRPEEG